jgi:hypothetical protein
VPRAFEFFANVSFLNKQFFLLLKKVIPSFWLGRVIIITRSIVIARKSIFITSDIFGRGGSFWFYLIFAFLCHEACVLGEVWKEWLAWWSFALDGDGCHIITFGLGNLITWVPFLTNMSLTIGLLLCEFFIFLVAFVKLLFLLISFLFPLIWTLGNEMLILIAIVAHPLWPWLLSSISFVRSSFLYKLVELLDE